MRSLRWPGGRLGWNVATVPGHGVGCCHPITSCWDWLDNTLPAAEFGELWKNNKRTEKEFVVIWRQEERLCTSLGEIVRDELIKSSETVKSYKKWSGQLGCCTWDSLEQLKIKTQSKKRAWAVCHEQWRVTLETTGLHGGLKDSQANAQTLCKCELIRVNQEAHC